MRSVQHYENRIARLIAKDPSGNYRLIQKARRRLRKIKGSK